MRIFLLVILHAVLIVNSRPLSHARFFVCTSRDVMKAREIACSMHKRSPVSRGTYSHFLFDQRTKRETKNLNEDLQKTAYSSSDLCSPDQDCRRKQTSDLANYLLLYLLEEEDKSPPTTLTDSEPSPLINQSHLSATILKSYDSGHRKRTNHRTFSDLRMNCCIQGCFMQELVGLCGA